MAGHGTVLALFLKVAPRSHQVASMMMRELMSGLLAHREVDPGRKDRSRDGGDEGARDYIT